MCNSLIGERAELVRRRYLDVDLYLVFGSPSPEALEESAGWVSDEERQHAEQFHQQRDSEAYLWRRALLRHRLQERTGMDGRRMRLVADALGKLSLGETPSTGPLDFNVSQSNELIAIAISNRGPVGVDVERRVEMADMEWLARDGLLHADEVAGWDAIPVERRPERLFDLWSVKEAILKCTGDGLTIDPPRVHVGHAAVEAGQGRVHLERPDRDPRELVFALCREFPKFAVAVATPPM